MIEATDKYLAITIAVCTLIIIGFSYAIQLHTPQSSVVVYDCRLSEISPDYPIAVKEACRKRNSGRI